MRKVILYVTVSTDGFMAGPNNELDWMLPMDEEMTADAVSLFNEIDGGFMGYPTASGMIDYWAGVAQNPSASKTERAIAQAVNKLHSVIVSNTPEELKWPNTELLLVKNDNDLIEGVRKIKQQPGRNLGVPGGIRTAQTFVRLGLIDEFVFVVHPVALGAGKPIFTNKVELEVVSTKTYKSGVMRICYRPRENTDITNKNVREQARSAEAL